MQARVGRDFHDETDFGGMVEMVCVVTQKRWREGTPAEVLGEGPPPPAQRWLVRPFLEYAGPSVLFSMGGGVKSLTSLALALTIASGRDIVGHLVGEPMPVIYSDWEADKYTHDERLRALRVGHGIKDHQPIYYRREYASLRDLAPQLRRDIALKGAGAWIGDSLGAARAGAPEEAGTTIDTFMAARSLGVPAWFVDHITKASLDQKGGALMPFGSVYTHNLARRTYRIDSAVAGDVTHISLANKKGNSGLVPRQSYRVEFENVTTEDGDQKLVRVEFSPAALSDSIELAAKVQLAPLLVAILRSHMKERGEGEGTGMTVKQFEERVDIAMPEGQTRPTGGSIKATLNKHRGTLFYSGPVPKGVEAVWTLVDNAHVES